MLWGLTTPADIGTVASTINLGGETYAVAFDHVAGKIYSNNYSADTIVRYNFDGTGLETVWTGDANILGPGLALDVGSGMIYWTNWNSGKIRRAATDGSGVIETLDTMTTPSAACLGYQYFN